MKDNPAKQALFEEAAKERLARFFEHRRALIEWICRCGMTDEDEILGIVNARREAVGSAIAAERRRPELEAAIARLAGIGGTPQNGEPE